MVFVYYLDQCNTGYWKLFFLGSWLASLLLLYWSSIRLLSSRTDERRLREADITGAAYARFKPNLAKRLRDVGVCAAIATAILFFYLWYYSIDRCTPDSIFWIGSAG